MLPSCCFQVCECRIGVVGAASGRRMWEEPSGVCLAEQMEKSSSNLMSVFPFLHSTCSVFAPGLPHPPSFLILFSTLPSVVHFRCLSVSPLPQHRLGFPKRAHLNPKVRMGMWSVSENPHLMSYPSAESHLWEHQMFCTSSSLT